jgi:hypothetical protein
MKIKDVYLRMGANNQETGTGHTKFDTRYRIYTITSTDGIEGYFSTLILPKQPYRTVVKFKAEARLGTASTAKAELHVHSSPYYGVVFDVVDTASIESTEWTTIELTYITEGKGNQVYPRLNLGVDNTTGTVEFRNMILETSAEDDIISNGRDRLLREKRYGSRFQNTQGVTPTTSGSGTIDDSTSTNYTEFTATGSDTAFITIDDFEGFQRNLNTSYYEIEIDAQVPVQASECVARFAFRDGVGGDSFYTGLLTQTIEDSVAATESYQTYKFIVVQDGSPPVIDSVEIELGAMTGFPSNCRIREARIRSYGLSTANLRPFHTQSMATVKKAAGIWEYDEDYRRENFATISEFDANTLSLTLAYRTGILPVAVVSPLNSPTVIPHINKILKLAELDTVRVEFRDTSGTLLTLASIADGTRFLIIGET